FYNSSSDSSTFQYEIGTLYHVEKCLFHLYKDKYILFNKKPWYANLWVIPEGWGLYNQDTPESSVVALPPYCLRPITDSELNLEATMPLILGAKGIFYYYKAVQTWGKANEGLIHTNMVNVLGLKTLNENSTKSGLDYILDDSLGGDYIKPRHDPAFKDHYIPNSNYNFTELGIDSNHVFIGTRSTRFELYKINQLIKYNEQTLLNLKLISWYAKGHRKWYVQDPSVDQVSDTLLNILVDLKNITTRKLFVPVLNDGLYYTVAQNEIEPDEDQFYDITLLRNGNDNIMHSYYIGLQNRRSDQLILRKIRNTDPKYKLCYYSSANLNDLCETGGQDPYDKNIFKPNYLKTYWQNIFHQRLGEREISIPLKKIHSQNNYHLIGYKVKELFNFDPTMIRKQPKFWEDDALSRRIEYFFPVSLENSISFDTINIKLMAGQGKIISVKPYYHSNYLGIISRKDTLNTNPVDTCEVLKHEMGLGFFKVSPYDANNCKYRIYFCNYSDSLNFNVPIGISIATEDSLVVSNADSLGFEFINYKTLNGFESYWIPKAPVTQETTYIGDYQSFCDSSKVIIKLGLRDCFKSDTFYLVCNTCKCCQDVNVNLAPLTTETLCFLRPYMSQTTMLPHGETCFYYGLKVSGGFAPTDSTFIDDLSIAYDSLNPQPINFPAYTKTLANQFMNIYCFPMCVYCLKLTYQNINGDDVCSKEVCITIDNSQSPPEITPPGAISAGCYSFQPRKENIPSEELHFGQKMIVDPNPTSGKANVKLNLEKDLVGRLVLYTSTGELIKEIFNGKLPGGTSDYQIDLSSQPSGMYIITIESDGMQYIKKFVKE
ncbi:MAG: T9SS type A sorting domain-containing protein, partial [bacterium]